MSVSVHVIFFRINVLVIFSNDVEKQLEHLFSDPEERKLLVELIRRGYWNYIPSPWGAVQDTIVTPRRAVFYSYEPILYNLKVR